MLCYATRRTVSIFSAFRFSCKCVENMERKGEKIMAIFNDVATNLQSYVDLYGSVGQRKTPLGKPLEYASGTRVERYSLRRIDGAKPYASQKVVTLPKNSPLRKLNLDKFELTMKKVRLPGDEIAPGFKKTLKLLDKDGIAMFEGADSIRKLMKSVALLMR